ncbi:uncharacterized protein B0H18DRAFT_1031474, partial [Fomitopsis serialis]|uniref:uncharacterized protein n=1 Tax=Fomitopsis serialis TaxID=139415 RepID=UPI002007A5E4
MPIQSILLLLAGLLEQLAKLDRKVQIDDHHQVEEMVELNGRLHPQDEEPRPRLAVKPSRRLSMATRSKSAA